MYYPPGGEGSGVHLPAQEAKGHSAYSGPSRRKDRSSQWLIPFQVIGQYGHRRNFTVLHIAKTLLRREFESVLNDAYEAQVFVRATSTADNDVLESASAKEKAFSLAHAVVKIYKIVELNLVPWKEDKLLNMPLCTYPQEYDHLSVDRMRQLSYPTGFSCQGDPIEKWKNPHLSETTMNILGVSEGTP